MGPVQRAMRFMQTLFDRRRERETKQLAVLVRGIRPL
jgi:hypothetical protein